MVVLKSIDPVSLGKVYAVIAAIFGLIYGIIIALVVVVAGASAAAMGMAHPFGGLAIGIIAILCIIGIPILAAVGGFIGAVIGAWIYNFVASKIGGVKIDLK